MATSKVASNLPDDATTSVTADVTDAVVPAESQAVEEGEAPIQGRDSREGTEDEPMVRYRGAAQRRELGPEDWKREGTTGDFFAWDWRENARALPKSSFTEAQLVIIRKQGNFMIDGEF